MSMADEPLLTPDSETEFVQIKPESKREERWAERGGPRTHMPSYSSQGWPTMMEWIIYGTVLGLAIFAAIYSGATRGIGQ